MSTLEPIPEQSSLTCFVIGPIGSRHADHGTAERETYEQSLRIMEEVIEPACSHVGLVPVRSDSLSRAGEINEQIFKRLRDDDVVIADLTGANANVMYELGLRHTRDKLTVQIGEFGRLPFDVNMIRTIQFSSSPIGLITAREELKQVLEAGISGDFDPVSATRLWTNTGEYPSSMSDSEMSSADSESSSAAVEDSEEDGFIDIMAESEDNIDSLAPALTAISECLAAFGELAQDSTAEMTQSDAAGKGMRGRLQVATRHAQRMSVIVDQLDTRVDHYVSVLKSVSAGTLALIGRMEEDESALDEAREFGMVTRRTAIITRESMGAFAGFVDSVNANARLSRVLREPSRHLTSTLGRFAEATSVIDEWDRRLQSLGVPIPDEAWEAKFSEADPTRVDEINAADGDTAWPLVSTNSESS